MAERHHVPRTGRKQQPAYDRCGPRCGRDGDEPSGIRHQKGLLGRIPALLYRHRNNIPGGEERTEQADCRRRPYLRFRRARRTDNADRRGCCRPQRLCRIYQHKPSFVGYGFVRYHALRRYAGQHRRDGHAQQPRRVRGVLRHSQDGDRPGQHTAEHSIHEQRPRHRRREAHHPWRGTAPHQEPDDFRPQGPQPEQAAICSARRPGNVAEPAYADRRHRLHQRHQHRLGCKGTAQGGLRMPYKRAHRGQGADKQHIQRTALSYRARHARTDNMQKKLPSRSRPGLPVL